MVNFKRRVCYHKTFQKIGSAVALSRAHKANIPARLIREKLNCTAAQFLAGGYTPSELQVAGFTPEQLAAAKRALAAQVAVAKVLPQGFPKNCSRTELSKAHYYKVSAGLIREKLHCTAAQLKAAGYDAKELANAGFTAQQLAAAGVSPSVTAGAQATKGFPSSGEDKTARYLEQLRQKQSAGLSASQRQNEESQLQQSMNTQAGDLSDGLVTCSAAKHVDC